MVTTINSIRRLSCYAVIRTGYSGNNYLLAHMRLVLALIAKKRYAHVEVRLLVQDFPMEYGYRIDYFAMRQILNLAIQQGYLTKKHNRSKFFPTEKNDEFSGIEREFERSAESVSQLSASFKQFANDNGVTYTDEETIGILLAYVNTQKLMHISGRIENIVEDKRVDHLFGRFILTIKEQHPVLFARLTDLVVGSVLADYLVYEELANDGDALSNVTFVIDTSVAFMALGLDIADRGEYYRSLLHTMKRKGAHVKLFRHSYDEMQQIILGAADWVDNIKYDPVYASDVAAYFHDICSTRDDVIEYSTTLRKRLEELDITILEVDYTQSNRVYQVDEDKLQQMLVARYKAANPQFDEVRKKASIDLDVKSLSLIYLLRGGVKPTSIADAKFVFVTANRTLNKVAFDFHMFIESSTKTLPCSITDVFLGTYLWLSDPTQIIKMNEIRMVANAYLAFKPTPELVAKLSHSVDMLLERGDIDANTCYTLKSNRYVMEKLAEKTLGDPDAFEETTPLDILRDIRAEGKNEGIRESEHKYGLKMETQKNEYERMLNASYADKMVLLDELISTMERELHGKRAADQENNRKLHNAEQMRKIAKVVIAVVYVLLVLLLIYGIVRIGIMSYKKEFDYLSIVLAVVPLLFNAAIFIVSWTTLKEINPAKILDIVVEEVYKLWCVKTGCSKVEKSVLNNEIKHLENNLEMLQQKKSELEKSIA